MKPLQIQAIREPGRLPIVIMGDKFVSGVDWNKPGKECDALALVLLMAAGLCCEHAVWLYQSFAQELHKQPASGWTMTLEKIVEWAHVYLDDDSGVDLTRTDFAPPSPEEGGVPW